VIGRFFTAALGAAVVIVLAVIAFPQLNPFGTETKDRSNPALLQSLQKLNEYRAARANLEQVVDIERDTKLVPSFLKGERTVLVAAGEVDARVDFRRLGPRALDVSPDRTQVVITLPAPELAPARLDLARTRVIDHDRGVIDRAGELLGDGGADDERQLLLAAQDKLDAAAAADKALLPTAERNTRAMLERLGRGLGFERVTVRFEQPPAL
jgi:glycine/D-amino acid oxidase-like deaminating enzyme